MTYSTPICIIGAGPGGLATSLYLSRKSIPHIVVEKETFPRHKACADSVSGTTLRALYEVEPDFVENLRGRAQLVDLTGVTFHAPNHHHFSIDFLPLEKGTNLPSCHGIRRIDFDQYLKELVLTYDGVQLLENFAVARIDRGPDGVLVGDASGRRRVQAQMVILATGSNSRLPQLLGAPPVPDQHRALGVRAYYRGVEYPIEQRHSELFLTKELMPGGFYFTPLSEDLVNVNVVMLSRVVKKRKVRLGELMQDLLRHHPVLKERFRRAELVSRIEGSALNLGTGRQPLSGDRFLLVGDAAGLIDLITANGIPQAFASARIAAEFAERAIAQNDFSAHAFADYDPSIYRRVENYLKLSKLVAPFLGRPWFDRLALGVLNFTAANFDRHRLLQELIYDSNVGKTLSRPSFYYHLLFGQNR